MSNPLLCEGETAKPDFWLTHAHPKLTDTYSHTYTQTETDTHTDAHAHTHAHKNEVLTHAHTLKNLFMTKSFITKSTHNDISVNRHYNGLCVVGIAPSHSLLKLVSEYTNTHKAHVQFEESSWSNKNSHVNVQAPICTISIECNEEMKKFVLATPISGEVIDFNAPLQNASQLQCHEPFNWLIVIRPKVHTQPPKMRRTN